MKCATTLSIWELFFPQTSRLNRGTGRTANQNFFVTKKKCQSPCTHGARHEQRCQKKPLQQRRRRRRRRRRRYGNREPGVATRAVASRWRHESRHAARIRRTESDVTERFKDTALHAGGMTTPPAARPARASLPARCSCPLISPRAQRIDGEIWSIRTRRRRCGEGMKSRVTFYSLHTGQTWGKPVRRITTSGLP